MRLIACLFALTLLVGCGTKTPLSLPERPAAADDSKERR